MRIQPCVLGKGAQIFGNEFRLWEGATVNALQDGVATGRRIGDDKERVVDESSAERADLAYRRAEIEGLGDASLRWRHGLFGNGIHGRELRKKGKQNFCPVICASGAKPWVRIAISC